MKQALKQLFAGFIYSLMTMSFILSPIPKVNVAWAEGKGVYRPGGDLSEVMEKAQISKYTDHQSSFAAILEQAVSGMMAVVLVKSLRWNYLHNIKGPGGLLYGDDCPANRAAWWTLKLAQIGSLVYLLGDIKANKKFIKASEKAVDNAFTPTPPPGAINEEELSEEERKKQEEHKDKQIAAFDTLIQVLEKQKDGIKAKKNALELSQLAYLAAFGVEAVSGVICASKCTSGRTLMETKLATFTTAAEATITAAAAESTINQGCSALGAAVGALQALTVEKKAANEGKDAAIASEKVAEEVAEKGKWWGIFLQIGPMIKEAFNNAVDYATDASKLAAADQAGAQGIDSAQLDKFKDVLKIPVESLDDATKTAEATAQASALAAILAGDETAVGTVATAGQGCTATRFLAGYTISAFVSYFYSPVECCGGPAHSPAVQKEILAGRTLLAGLGDTLAGSSTANVGKDYAIDKAKSLLAKQGVKEAGQKALETALKSIDPSGIAATALEGSSTDNPTLLTGTMPGFGLPAVPSFWGKKDLRVMGFFEGLFGDSGVDPDIKFFVKSNFESLLRRLAINEQLESIDFNNPGKELREVAELEQKINHVMFYFNQMVDDLGNKGLALNEFKKHDLWPTVMGMVGNLIMPEAHANFIMGIAGGMASQAAFKFIVKALGLKGATWEAILNVGSQYMLVSALLSKIGKSWAFVSPSGRTTTWTAMNVVNLAVKSLDEKAEDKIDKYIKTAKDEKERYIKGAYGHSPGKETNNGNLKFRKSRGDANLAMGGSSGVKSCAVPKGNGFAPALCPAKVPKSAFTLPKEARKVVDGMPSAFNDSINMTSRYASGLSSGELGADDLSGMDMGAVRKANEAMRKFNEKIMKKVEDMEKESYKRAGQKYTPLATIKAQAKKHLLSEPARNVLASLPSANQIEEASKEQDEEESTAVVKSNPFDFKFTAPKTKKKNTLDFGFGDEGGVESEDAREVAKAEEDLGDFVLQHDDINKRKDVSIFKILSNRYLLSYPKVLDEKKPQDN